MSDWKEWEIDYVRQHFPATSTRLISQTLRRSDQKVRDMAAALGVIKDREYLRMVRRTAAQKGGRKPIIKGKECCLFRQIEWPKWLMPPMPHFRNCKPRAIHFCKDDE